MNRFMSMYPRGNLRLMQRRSGLQGRDDVFWQVMEVKFPVKN